MKDEVELESIVTDHIDALESGLVLLDHQRRTETGRLDILCVNAEGALVIVELKMKEDDGMLMQALDYLDYVNENKDRFATFYTKKLKNDNKQLEVDKTVAPRIILVAPTFSDSLRSAVKYVNENYSVALKQFRYLKSGKTGETAPYFIEVDVEPPTIYEEPKTVEDHLNAITDEDVRDVVQTFIEQVKSLGNGITAEPAQYWIALFYKGKRVVIIEPRRHFVNAYITKSKAAWADYPWTKIQQEADYNPSFLEAIKKRFVEMGGQLKT